MNIIENMCITSASSCRCRASALLGCTGVNSSAKRFSMLLIDCCDIACNGTREPDPIAVLYHNMYHHIAACHAYTDDNTVDTRNDSTC
jgi:hypothetical protein